MGKGSQEEKHEGEVVEESKNLLESPQNRTKSEDDGPPPPPDGGWGWVVVAASFLCNMVLDGIGYSFGILLVPLMKHYNEGKGTISMVRDLENCKAWVLVLVHSPSQIENSWSKKNQS